MSVRIIGVDKQDAKADAGEPRLIDASRVKDGASQCMSCLRTDGAIVRIEDSLARMLRGKFGDLLSSYDNIYMHGECLDEIIGDMPRQEAELRAEHEKWKMEHDSYQIVVQGTDRDRAERIMQGLETLRFGQGTDRSVAYAIARYGSDRERIMLAKAGIEVLRIGEGTQWSVAWALICNGSGGLMEKLVRMGPKVAMIGEGTNWCAGFALAFYGSNGVRRRLMDMGMEVMRIGAGTRSSVAGTLVLNGSRRVLAQMTKRFGKEVAMIGSDGEWPLAYELAEYGSEEVREWLVGMGMDVLRIGEENDIATVAWALLKHGSDRIRRRFIETGKDAVMIGRDTLRPAAYALAVWGWGDVRKALICMGIDVLGIAEGWMRSVACALASFGSEADQMALMDFGEKAVRIGEGTRLSVALALDDYGSWKVKERLRKEFGGALEDAMRKVEALAD